MTKPAFRTEFLTVPLAAKLIDDAQHPECFAIMGAISDEVIRPDVVRSLRAQTDTRSVIEPEPPTLKLFGRDF